MNTTFGRHLLAEYRDCATSRLNDLEFVEALMKRAAETAQAEATQASFHRFSPQGVSGVVVTEGTQLSIRTWPDGRYAAVEFYERGLQEPEHVLALLVEGLKASHFELLEMPRSGCQGSSISRSHHVVSEPTSIAYGA